MEVKDRRVAIAGLGTVGRAVAEAIDSDLSGDLSGYRLAAVASGRADRARDFVDGLRSGVAVVSAQELATHADLVIECAPPTVFREIAAPAIQQGRQLVVLSVGALLGSWDLVDHAQNTGAEVLVPTGALLGLDAVQAAALGTVRSVRMVTRKPLGGLAGAPYLTDRGMTLANVREPVRLFRGSAREAVNGFPANLNVAVALSLAGIGPDRTEVEVWADPTVVRNTHRIDVDADSVRFSLAIENVPSENPRTGRITALSVVALLRKLASPLKVGT
ncbi:MAG: aspartate dehydrogenase [Nocardioidaceae bacterium]